MKEQDDMSIRWATDEPGKPPRIITEPRDDEPLHDEGWSDDVIGAPRQYADPVRERLRARTPIGAGPHRLTDGGCHGEDGFMAVVTDGPHAGFGRQHPTYDGAIEAVLDALFDREAVERQRLVAQHTEPRHPAPFAVGDIVVIDPAHHDAVIAGMTVRVEAVDHGLVLIDNGDGSHRGWVEAGELRRAAEALDCPGCDTTCRVTWDVEELRCGCGRVWLREKGGWQDVERGFAVGDLVMACDDIAEVVILDGDKSIGVRWLPNGVTDTSAIHYESSFRHATDDERAAYLAEHEPRRGYNVGDVVTVIDAPGCAPVYHGTVWEIVSCGASFDMAHRHTLESLTADRKHIRHATREERARYEAGRS